MDKKCSNGYLDGHSPKNYSKLKSQSLNAAHDPKILPLRKKTFHAKHLIAFRQERRLNKQYFRLKETPNQNTPILFVENKEKVKNSPRYRFAAINQVTYRKILTLKFFALKNCGMKKRPLFWLPSPNKFKIQTTAIFFTQFIYCLSFAPIKLILKYIAEQSPKKPAGDKTQLSKDH